MKFYSVFFSQYRSLLFSHLALELLLESFLAFLESLLPPLLLLPLPIFWLIFRFIWLAKFELSCLSFATVASKFEI